MGSNPCHVLTAAGLRPAVPRHMTTASHVMGPLLALAPCVLDTAARMHMGSEPHWLVPNDGADADQSVRPLAVRRPPSQYATTANKPQLPPPSTATRASSHLICAVAGAQQHAQRIRAALRAGPHAGQSYRSYLRMTLVLSHGTADRGRGSSWRRHPAQFGVLETTSVRPGHFHQHAAPGLRRWVCSAAWLPGAVLSS